MDLKETLWHARLSQSQFAKEIGVSKQAVSLWIKEGVSKKKLDEVKEWFTDRSLLVVE